jgi:hypothetical protein
MIFFCCAKEKEEIKTKQKKKKNVLQENNALGVIGQIYHRKREYPLL